MSPKSGRLNLMKLYHYVHCPFCVRVRMGLGFLALPYESVVLPYDDEETPLKLTGKKMLPIFESDDGISQNESLDILKKLDSKNLLNWDFLKKHQSEVDSLLSLISSPVHSLAMPYWIWTPEFNEKSRHYFQSKKEIKRGPFKILVKNKNQFTNEIKNILENNLLPHCQPFYKNSTLSIVDIMIASHLWGLFIVPEFQFDKEVLNYLLRIQALTKFNYHEDFWN